MENYSQKPEDKARHDLINPLLTKCGWKVEHFKTANIYASKGVAVEFFQLGKGVGEADYVLFVDGKACGVIEAKKEGMTLIGKEAQSNRYAQKFPEDFQCVEMPLPFVYESTGTETRFTNLWDPKPRSREVFAFHKPETLEKWIVEGKNTLRKRLTQFPALENKKLWPAQETAVLNLEKSFAGAKPKALIQMATGSGKTFTAVNICHRLIKNAKAKRILFLVDRGNLGVQTELEFETFTVPQDGRKFTELYNVHRLESNAILDSDKVCISTIQRVYSMLRGEKKFEEINEERSGFEDDYSFEPIPLEYNKMLPPETFDFIIVDECHRSIYNLWKQVLDYFDGFLIGLTATPSKGTIGFFDKNLVMEYGHAQAVADQVNVDFDVYRIRTKITKEGSLIPKGETILKRDMRTRRKRWETLDDDVKYNESELDRKVVSKDQIRTVIRTFRDKVRTEIFPGRKHVPKTLIFAKDDAHAEEIVQIIREEFNEGNEFAQKITYKTEGDTDALLRSFRNDFNPRIAVTVDMIATGTDVKPLEIVFFMRSVKSRNYFEQMKGRGVRVMKNDDFKAVTPDAMAKERFVIIDAVGVCESEELNETRQMDQNPTVSFPKLLKALRYGKPKIENLSSMASRLSRLQKKLTEKQLEEIEKITSGFALSDFASAFVDAIDEDQIFEQAQKEFGDGSLYKEYAPKKKELDEVAQKRMILALQPFIGNAKLMERLPEIKEEVEQIVDDVSIDVVEEAGYSPMAKEKAKSVITSFKKFISDNKKELTAIQVFYNKGRLHWDDLKEMADVVMGSPYGLTTSKLWQAYNQLEDGKVHGKSQKEKIADFISLLKYEIEKVEVLEPFSDSVDKKFSSWLGKKIASGVSFSQEQLNWLEKIKQHIADSVEITPDDFDDAPFVQLGGLGKAYTVFGKSFDKILEELNSELGV
ncbi:DEAD/DEAH box helicase family protein [Candidatus Woesearchaeota archaeon]|nr:DEAD/DEAH box helicase family protein [Candidatus Woesearchaeota archaeon]